MKKVRFMLLAIAVIAFAGGTLAFKAKFNAPICTTLGTTHPTIANSYTCLVTEPGETPFTATCSIYTEGFTERYQVAIGEIPVCYTLSTEDGECPTTVTGTNCELILITLEN